MRTLFFLLLLPAFLLADEAEMKARLDAAEKRIQQLEEREGADLRDAVDEYLKESRPPEHCPAPGPTDGFGWSDPERRFSIRVNGYAQLRTLYDNKDEALDDAHRWGFENTRTKLILTGTAGSPRLSWKVQGDFDVDGGEFELEDCWAQWDFGNGFFAMAGQMRCPIAREEKVDDNQQLCVDKSNVNDVFMSGEPFGGVTLTYGREQWRVWGAWSNGDGVTNSPALGEDTEYAFTFRGEFLVFGDWRQFADFTSFRGEERALLLGLGAHTQKSEFGTPATTMEVFMLTFDASLELGGANVFVQVLYANVERGADPTRDLFGLVLQGGYFIAPKLELFGRYEYGDLDPVDGIASPISILTFGANYYIHGHDAKVSVDFGYGLQPVPAVGKYSGWRVDNPLADGQFVFRMQFQWGF